MQQVKFKDRQTEVWVYPRISKYFSKDILKNAFFDFLNKKQSVELPVNLYIHIPFCDSFCFFCPYYKVRYLTCPEEVKQRVIQGIINELIMYSKTEYFQNCRIGSLYFGGGDGAIITTKALDLIFETVVNNFNLDESFTVSLEGHVWSLSNDEKLDWFKGIGGEHLSFGIQTFKEEIRKKVFLKPSEKDIYYLSELLHKKGLNNFACDMIYNFPEQTLEDLKVDIDKSVSLDAMYIDIHNLNVYPNTKFEKTIRAGKYFTSSPTNEMEAKMYQAYIEGLEKKEYHHLGSIYFSKTEKKPYKTFVKQSRSYPVLGIGPSARTYIERRSYRNWCSVDEYCDFVEKHKYPIEAGNIATEEEDVNRIMVFFPQVGYIEKEYIPKTHDVLEKIDILLQSGYVEWKDDVLRLTKEGIIYCGNVASYFYSNKQKECNLKTIFMSMKDKSNPYNQDKMGS